MTEEMETIIRWLVADSDQSNNPKTLIMENNNNKMGWSCKILIIQSTLGNFQWDWSTRKTLKGKAKEETTNRLSMAWYRMGRWLLALRTHGNLLTLRPFRMICHLVLNRTKVLCSNLAAIRPKTWYLDQLLSLKSLGHQLPKVATMHIQQQQEVDRDHQELLTTLKTNSMQSMEEEWAFKEMARQLMGSQVMQKES